MRQGPLRFVDNEIVAKDPLNWQETDVRNAKKGKRKKTIEIFAALWQSRAFFRVGTASICSSTTRKNRDLWSVISIRIASDRYLTVLRRIAFKLLQLAAILS